MHDTIMKIEYETTNIDIDTLCQKYNVDKYELSWYTEPVPIEPEVLPIEHNVREISASELRESVLLDTAIDIKEFALQRAKEMLEGEDLSTKEIKDLVAITDTIESSIRPSENTAPVVNVLVQNLMEAKDDC